MNIKNSKYTPAIGREIISVLNSCTIDLSIEQSMQELQLAVERLTFGSESMGSDMTINDIDNLLGSDVSEGTFAFLKWMYRRGLLHLMVGEKGVRMLSLCGEYYRRIKQVRVNVPIPVDDHFRIRLLAQLRRLYPEPTRIVFKTTPTLIAGCMIEDGDKVVDMSLGSKAPGLIGQFIRAQWSLERLGYER